MKSIKYYIMFAMARKAEGFPDATLTEPKLPTAF